MSPKLSQLILLTESSSPPTPKEIGDQYLLVVDELLGWLDRARRMKNADAYSALHNHVNDVREDLRESVQALTRDQMRHIISQLQEGEPITEEDIRLIRLWVVGDADAYVDEENNFGDWVDELQRLGQEIRNLRSAAVEPEKLKQLQALLTDARAVILSISNFLAHKERVDRFEETMSGGLDDERRQTLAEILSRSYHSPRA